MTKKEKMMSEKLKACPKCRSPIPPWVIRHEDRDGTINGWYVECGQCSLTCGRLFGTEEEAIDNWNTRYHPSCGDCVAECPITFRDSFGSHERVRDHVNYCSEFVRRR